MNYFIFIDDFANDHVVCLNGELKSFIPVDPANSDYQQYLEWLAEGNTPEPWEVTNGPE